ncbi:MAG: hypothetical protein R3D34_10465 [Nitratireductor sp.]
MPFSLGEPSTVVSCADTNTRSGLTRRRLIAATAAGSAVASIASSLPLATAAKAASGRVAANPCIEMHAEAGQVLAGIAGDPEIAPELKARIAMTASCPHCGTRLAGTMRAA